MRKFIAWIVGILLFAAAVFFWAYLPIQYIASAQPIVAGGSLVSGGLIFMILITIAPIGRVQKGIFLVGLAIITALLNTVAVEPMFALLSSERGKYIAGQEQLFLHFGGWIKEHLQMDSTQFLDASTKWINAMLSFINVACAGAGGSLIAVEGDRKSVKTKDEVEGQIQDSNVSTPIVAAPDTSPLVQALGGKIDRQSDAISDLSKLISRVEAQLNTINAQQVRINRVSKLTAIVIAAGFSFTIGAVVFGRS